MSPLAYSLLALTALLATAVAEPDPFCGELVQGTRTYTSHYFTLKGPGGVFMIEDRCVPPGAVGSERVGQHVVVCNEPNSKPKLIAINDMDEIEVECPNNTYGCEEVTVEVIQYCDVTAPL